MAKLIGIAFAAASGIAAASAGSAEDAAALLQVNTAVGQLVDSEIHGNRSEPTPWKCRCLNWKDVYANHNTKCGDGLEFAFLLKDRYHYPGLVSDMCTRFFTAYEDNHCIQTVFDGRSRDEWCYVDKSCTQLNGGKAVEGAGASYKICNDVQDRTLREESPDKLLQISRHTGMDPAYLMKMAYPVWDVKIPGFHWPGAQEALKLREEHGELPQKKDYLHYIESLNTPWILDSYDGHPPYGLVWGKKIIECKLSPWYFETMPHVPEILAHQEKITVFECVAGCDEPFPDFHGARNNASAPADWN